jgi:RNA polymerase sigma-70 factor (ECF subfamily)
MSSDASDSPDRVTEISGTPGAINAPDLGELLKLSGRGDEAAFAQLYDATAARAFGLAVRVVRDPAQAEEVSQEAFLEIWRTASRFDPAKGSAVSWILTLVHRKSVDRVRSAEASTRRDTTYHQGSQAVDHDSTAEAAQASMEARRVRQAMGSLTEVQRQALELAYFKGYTHTEVAAMLDLPVGTAKTRIRDGLIRLRDTMGVGQ